MLFLLGVCCLCRTLEVRNPAELPPVEAHESEVTRAGERGDQEVVRADGRTRPLQVRPYDAVLLGRPVVEGEALERLEETVEYPQVVFDSGALAGFVVEFALAHPAHHYLRRRAPTQPDYRLRLTFDESYGGVGVEKKPQVLWST